MKVFEINLTTKEASKYYGVAEQTMINWRHLCRGPEYFKLSTRAIRYRKSDLDAYMEKVRVKR